MKLSDLFESDQPRFISMEKGRILKIMQKYCKDAMWMLKKNKPLYRGMRGDMADAAKEVSVVNTTKTTRKSANTTNHYTVLIDNNPANVGYPKRSRSFICSTSPDTASGYGKSYAIIPFDGVPIGEIRSSDMWRTQVKFENDPDMSDAISSLNELFDDKLHIKDTIEDFKAFDAKLKEDPEFEDEIARKLVRYSGWFWPDKLDAAKRLTANFYDELMKSYTADNLGFKLSTTKTLDRELKQEVWVGGNCLVMRRDIWTNLAENYNETH